VVEKFKKEHGIPNRYNSDSGDGTPNNTPTNTPDKDMFEFSDDYESGNNAMNEGEDEAESHINVFPVNDSHLNEIEKENENEKDKEMKLDNFNLED